MLEKFAAMVVETCWFQKKITPLIGGIKFVADLPKELVEIIINKIRGFLPESLHDIFANVDRSSVSVSASDVECEADDPAATRLTSEREELMNLQEKLGDEKFQAFLALTQKAGVPSDLPLTVELIKRIGETIENSGVTAEQMQQYAERYPTVPDGMPVDLATFLEGVKSGVGGTGGAATPPATPPDTGTTTPSVPETGKSGSEARSPEKGTAATPGGGSLPVVDAKDRPFLEEPGQSTIPHAVAQVVNQSESHRVGTTPQVDMIGFVHGVPLVMVINIKTKVIKRTWFPQGSDQNTATGLVIHYEILEGVSFAPQIPGGLLEGQIARALLKR